MPGHPLPDTSLGYWVRLPFDIARAAPKNLAPLLMGSTIEAIERELILATLAAVDGRRTSAAAMLGISVRTLSNRIREYRATGLAVPGPDQRH